MNKTYDDMLDWLAHVLWARWNADTIGWKSTVGDAVTTIAHMYDKTAYDVSRDVWDRVEELYGDPIMGTAPKTKI